MCSSDLDTIMGNTHSQELTLTDSTNTLYDYNCYINILDNNTTQWDTNTNTNKKLCKTKYNTTSFKRIETNTFVMIIHTQTSIMLKNVKLLLI